MDELQVAEFIYAYIAKLMDRAGLENNDYAKGHCRYFTAEDVENGMKSLAVEMLNNKSK